MNQITASIVLLTAVAASTFPDTVVLDASDAKITRATAKNTPINKKLSAT
jgi:hypothetical protein